MTTRLHAGRGTVWPAVAALCTAKHQPRRGPARAAIAYVGSTADTWLGLRSGDILICDASDDAVTLGLTSPKQLRRWHEHGVRIWSLAGLHAKTGVFGRVGFIGSANASQTSAEERYEAVVTTTDTAVCRDIRAFVERHRAAPAQEVTEAFLDRLDQLPVRHVAWPHAVRHRDAVRGSRVFLSVDEPDKWNKDEASFADDDSQQPEHEHSDHVRVSYVDSADDLQDVRNGDVFSWYGGAGGWVSAPHEILGTFPRQGRVRAGFWWLERGDLRPLRRSMVDASLLTADRGRLSRWYDDGLPADFRLQGRLLAAYRSLPWHRATDQS